MTSTENSNHPRFCPTVIGHDESKAFFKNAFAGERCPHGWMLAGPKSIGKASFLYQFIAELLSEKTHNLDQTRSQIAEKTHPNLLVIEREEKADITVDQMRAVGAFLRGSSATPAPKIVLIDSIDEANNNAANAVLKLLEEPPKNCYFFLISHRPESLLPTIRSRCQMHRFSPLSKVDLATILKPYMLGEPQEVVEQIIHLSRGAPGMALQLAQEGQLQAYHQLCALLVQRAPSAESIYRLGEYFAKEAHHWQWVSYFFYHVIGQVMRQYHEPAVANQALKDEQAAVKAISSQYPLEKLAKIWDKQSEMLRDVDHLYLDKKTVFYQMVRSVT